MYLSQHFKSSFFIALAGLSIAGCEVVELDGAGKPIIPMSAEEAASLSNMDPKDIAAKVWNDLVQDANKSPITLEVLESQKQNDKSYFVRFTGVVEKIETKSKYVNVNINVGNTVIPVQVGSMVKGNAIRDASPLLPFDQFKNQIQYSKLSKELNQSAVKSLSKLDDSSIGKKVDVLSALTIKNGEIQDAVPLDIKVVE